MILRIANRTKGTLLADRASIAGTAWSRMVGLLNRSSLAAGEGLWIPTSAIHTVGMRFAIDALFLGKMTRLSGRGACRVRRVYHSLRPFRMTRFVWGSESVLELPAGVAAATETEAGDELEFQRE